MAHSFTIIKRPQFKVTIMERDRATVSSGAERFYVRIVDDRSRAYLEESEVRQILERIEKEEVDAESSRSS